MGLQKLLVDARPEVEAFQERGRGEFQQILEPGAVLGQQGQVELASFMLAASLSRRLPGATYAS